LTRININKLQTSPRLQAQRGNRSRNTCICLPMFYWPASDNHAFIPLSLPLPALKDIYAPSITKYLWVIESFTERIPLLNTFYLLAPRFSQAFHATLVELA